MQVASAVEQSVADVIARFLVSQGVKRYTLSLHDALPI